MEFTDKIRKQENLHIVLWLIKDSCWMLELKWLGAFMVIPAVAMACRISYLTRRTPEFFLNAAILFWILANSYWMIVEFFFENAHKNFAGVPFALGFICVGLYYYLLGRGNRGSKISQSTASNP